MPQFHQQTKHSYFSIRANSRFLDWNSQPCVNKFYPKFYARFSSMSDISDFDLISKTTFEYKQRAYSLRSTPSAGALYPCEVYFQARNVSGLIDGIYHYEQASGTNALLCELTDDGIEPYFEDNVRFDGIVFLISAVYFRSSWKYLNRAIRYILLDSGHQIGAVLAMLNLHNMHSKICFEFDKQVLNQLFGFENFEFFMASVKCCDIKQANIKRLRLPLAFVSPSDYLERNEFIQNAYLQSCNFASSDIVADYLFKGISKDTIIKRRSIRAFEKKPIGRDEFLSIMDGIAQFANQHNIDIFYTLHRVDGMTLGLYHNNELKVADDFSLRATYLSLEQNIGGDSGFCVYFTSNEIERYQQAYMLCGVLAHIIYLRATMLDIGTSGIGAYYDDEVKKFLDTSNNILYLLAVGR